MDIRPNFSKGSTTPPINPQAIVGHEELPKQVNTFYYVTRDWIFFHIFLMFLFYL